MLKYTITLTLNIIIRLCIIFCTTLFLNIDDSSSVVYGVKFTGRQCNFTTFPKTGCEQPEAIVCVENKCACIHDSHYLIYGRFCVEKLCPNGEYYSPNRQLCNKQSRASLDVTENHCRYDFHCFGEHVTCKQHGWNFNCVCDAGFRYDSLTETCLPKYGIGGHCKRDTDCDETTLRKMLCYYNETLNNDKNNNMEPAAGSTGTGGTCQCIDNHRYNYNVDGCEPLADIARREHNVRTLVLLFVVFGCLFGLAMTCNLNFFGVGGPKPYEILMQRIKTQERIRQLQQQRSIDSTISTESTANKTLSIDKNIPDKMVKIDVIYDLEDKLLTEVDGDNRVRQQTSNGIRYK